MMSSCPSDETLASLLADALSTAERDALAGHIEECAACLERLVRLSEIADADALRPAAQTPPCSETEEEIVRRLKMVRFALASSTPNSADTPTMDVGHDRS